ncbi:toxin-antitoxin system HicB family antitoxin [Acinetobacter baretiae]|uniref:toxin-antitoxin system HicB family antitoxin n=1 Tax=Acinetobacter baretiae TaxID=2605383 RepID=UPI0039A48423
MKFESVACYLELCTEKPPDQPGGTFNVRIIPEMHHKVVLASNNPFNARLGK